MNNGAGAGFPVRQKGPGTYVFSLHIDFAQKSKQIKDRSGGFGD
jgi:hypothetical protein